MKNYNTQNYLRHKEDLNSVSLSNPTALLSLSRDELIVLYMPFAENIAKKFSTSELAIGSLQPTDLLQEAYLGLVLAVDKINRETLSKSDNPKKVLNSFIYKRVFGSIREGIDNKRSGMRITRSKIEEIRRGDVPENEAAKIFLASVFFSLDKTLEDDDTEYSKYIPEAKNDYNPELALSYLIGLMKSCLSDKEFNTVDLFYGLTCEKMPAKEIVNVLDYAGSYDVDYLYQVKQRALRKLESAISKDELYVITEN